MKFLVLSVALLVALVAAGGSDKSKSFRGDQKKGASKYQKWRKRTTPKPEKCDPNKKTKCTQKDIPKDLQTQYLNEFKAIDVNNNGCVDATEFKGVGTKISEQVADELKARFQHYRQSGGFKKYSKGKGKKTDTKGKSDESGDGQQKQNPRRPRRDGGRRLGGSSKKSGSSSKKSSTGSNFWKYLQGKGFKRPEQTQAQKDAAKDKMEARRAAGVFKRFDNDGNSQMSECEYANSMLKMKKFQEKMDAYKKKNDNDVVFVHG